MDLLDLSMFSEQQKRSFLIMFENAIKIKTYTLNMCFYTRVFVCFAVLFFPVLTDTANGKK